MPKKYVLTGGPATGKTTTAQALMEKGFPIVPEAARFVIEQEQSRGGDVLPWKNFEMFQIVVTRKQVELEASIKDAQVVFLDRGVVDNVAYCKFRGIDTPAEILETARLNKYHGVFLLDMLPIYEKDSARKEDPVTAAKIHESIKSAYSELGYDVIQVPPLSVRERIELILSKV